MGAITDVPWPALSPTTATKTIKAYPYVQYQDDDNISCWFDALNIYSQAYVDWFNNLNLPIYTQAPVEGPLLDWVASCLYGITRPGLPVSQGSPAKGPINTYAVNSMPVNGYVDGTPETYVAVNDDYFRRIMTWKLYKGDGQGSSITWLKRRINRFLFGTDGKDIANNTTFYISIVPTGPREYTISIPGTTAGTIFMNAVAANVIELPFQIQWTIVLDAAGNAPFQYDTTGTGAEQTFSLPYAVLSPQSLIVSVNGLRAPSTDYVVSGTQVTLTTTAPGDLIEVVGPTGSTPDPWIVTATGTGAPQNIVLPATGLVPAAVLVYSNGIRWATSEYSITGNQLTMTTNAEGDTIEIIPL